MGLMKRNDDAAVDVSFDDLTRGLGNGTLSRGGALALMGTALVGSMLGFVPGVAWAACPEGQTRCGDRCVNLQTNERHCGSCGNRCSSTQTCCKGRCVNVQRNERHCGSCFNRCPEDSECVGGVCQGGVCPDLICCCTCVNRLSDGSEAYSCTAGATFIDDAVCRQYCSDTAPPGAELFSYGYGCTTPETYPGQRYICLGSSSIGFGCNLQDC